MNGAAVRVKGFNRRLLFYNTLGEGFSEAGAR